MESGGKWTWYLLIGALAAAGIYTFVQVIEPSPPTEPLAALAPAQPPPLSSRVTPRHIIAAEPSPAELTAIEAEQTLRKLDEDQQKEMMEMTPLPPDAVPEPKY